MALAADHQVIVDRDAQRLGRGPSPRASSRCRRTTASDRHWGDCVCNLPGGAKRLRQKADGMRATIVNGQVLLRDNEPTGNLPGKLIRKGARH